MLYIFVNKNKHPPGIKWTWRFFFLKKTGSTPQVRKRLAIQYAVVALVTSSIYKKVKDFRL